MSIQTEERKEFLKWKSEIDENAEYIVKTKIKEKILSLSSFENKISNDIEGSDMVIDLNNTISSNEKLLNHLKKLKEEAMELYDIISDLNLHLSMRILPKYERTSFKSQLDILYFKRAKDLKIGCQILLSELKGYIESRAIHIKKAVKHDKIEDYQKSIDIYDDVKTFNLSMWFTSIQKEYLILDNCFTVNGIEF